MRGLHRPARGCRPTIGLSRIPTCWRKLSRREHYWRNSRRRKQTIGMSMRLWQRFDYRGLEGFRANVLAWLILYAVLAAPALNFARWIGKQALILDALSVALSAASFAVLYFYRYFLDKSLDRRWRWHRWLFPPPYWQTGTTMLYLVVACLGGVVISLSAVTYDLAINFGIYNPFGVHFGVVQALLFFLDHALKGMLFDVMEVFDLHVQNDLRFRARDFPAFGVLVVMLRMAVSICAIGLLLHFVRKLELPQRLARYWQTRRRRQTPQQSMRFGP